MNKPYSINNKTTLFFFLAACYVFFIAYFRFTHQDIGWYYSYADRLASKFSLNNSQSDWSYVDANGDNGAGGIIFIGLQFLAILLSTNDLLAIKILSGLIAFSTIISFFYLLKKRLNIENALLFSFFLLIDPVLTYQIMNRPELLGCCIALLIFNISLNKQCTSKGFFWMTFLSALLLDIHPTSLYMVVGLNAVLFLWNYKKVLYFLGGGLAGICLITGLNYIFNNSLGFMAILGNSKQFLNDHYFPIFTDPLNIILTRPLVKLKYFVVYLLFGIALYYLIIHYKQLKALFYSNRIYTLLAINAGVFLLLSNLFSEGGNGYHLYSLLVYLPILIIIYDEILKRSTGNAKRIFIGFLLLIPAFGLYKSVPRINDWIKNNTYFSANYMTISSLVKEGDKLLVRPTFSFALSKQKVFCEPAFPLLMYMYNSKLSFARAVAAKGFDIVAIDEMFLRDADLKAPSDKYSNGPFYKAIQEVRFDTGVIKVLQEQRIFVPMLEFNDFYHGKTIFYKVNKELLKKYCAINR